MHTISKICVLIIISCAVIVSKPTEEKKMFDVINQSYHENDIEIRQKRSVIFGAAKIAMNVFKKKELVIPATVAFLTAAESQIDDLQSTLFSNVETKIRTKSLPNFVTNKSSMTNDTYQNINLSRKKRCVINPSEKSLKFAIGLTGAEPIGRRQKRVAPFILAGAAYAGKTLVWSLGVGAATVGGGVGIVYLTQGMNERAAIREEKRLRDRMMRACEYYNTGCILGYCWSNCGPRFMVSIGKNFIKFRIYFHFIFS